MGKRISKWYIQSLNIHFYWRLFLSWQSWQQKFGVLAKKNKFPSTVHDSQKVWFSLALNWFSPILNLKILLQITIRFIIQAKVTNAWG